MKNPEAGKAFAPNRATRRHPTGNDTSDGPQKLLVTVAEGQEILSLSRTRIYQLIESGEIQTVQIGRRRMIVVAGLEAFVERKIAEAA